MQAPLHPFCSAGVPPAPFFVGAGFTSHLAFLWTAAALLVLNGVEGLPLCLLKRRLYFVLSGVRRARAQILRIGLSLVVRNRDGNPSFAGIARRVGALNPNRVHAVASLSRALRPQHDLKGTNYLPIG